MERCLSNTVGRLSDFASFFLGMFFCFAQNGNFNSAKFEVSITNSNNSCLCGSFLCNTVAVLQLFFFSSGSFCEVDTIPTYKPTSEKYLLTYLFL